MRATGSSPAHATASTAPRTCLAPTRPPQLRPRPRRRTRAPMTRLLWPNARELPLGETRSRTVTRFSPCPSGDLLRARHAGPARTLATTDSAASARGQPQRRDWQADGPCRPEAVTLSMSTVLSHATTSGQQGSRDRGRLSAASGACFPRKSGTVPPRAGWLAGQQRRAEPGACIRGKALV
jgi:hypothetical protein